MLSRTLVRRGGSGSPARALLRHYHQTPALASSPGRPATVVDGGFWRSLIPKPMRRESQGRRGKKSSSWLSTDGQWNPATFYIVIFLLIGSMSIQMIALRNSFQSYMRRSEVRIGLLRDVVERIQRGETVNVEKALGTGNAEKEADWEEVLRSIESQDGAPKTKKRREPEPQPTETTEQPQQQEPVVEAPPKGKPASFGNFF